jgi:hypothetical protein
VSPYIVTTNRQAYSYSEDEFGRATTSKPQMSRRGVETLNEAKAHALQAAGTDHHIAFRSINNLTEQGGTITLPDGTVIEIEKVNGHAVAPALCPACGAGDCTTDTCPGYAEWHRQGSGSR